MFEVIYLLLVCVCTWLTIRSIRKPRRKRKVNQSKVPLIEQLFGYSAWLWLTMKLNPNINYDELLVTVQTNKEPIGDAKTNRYTQRTSGLWVPAK